MIQNVRQHRDVMIYLLEIIIIATRNITIKLMSEYRKIFTVFSQHMYNNDSTGSDSYSVFRVRIQFNITTELVYVQHFLFNVC